MGGGRDSAHLLCLKQAANQKNYEQQTHPTRDGGSPSLVVVDRGMATALTTTTINSGTYAFFNQRGLMAGLGLQGSKITRINPQR